MTEERQMNDVVYEVGAVVPEDGHYACVPCGDRKFLKAGTRFTACLACFGKGSKEFQKGLELWEKVSAEHAE